MILFHSPLFLPQSFTYISSFIKTNTIFLFNPKEKDDAFWGNSRIAHGMENSYRGIQNGEKCRNIAELSIVKRFWTIMTFLLMQADISFDASYYANTESRTKSKKVSFVNWKTPNSPATRNCTFV